MRYWEIDAVRGVAVLLMIAYHAAFDITYFTSGNTPFWFATIVASLFIITSGISLSISYSRGGNFSKFAKRGLKLLILGFLITGISYLLLKEGAIVFGIIHFFAVSSFLIYIFLKYLKGSLSHLFVGILIIIIGVFISGVVYENSYFLWLGLKPAGFYSFDYFPLLPWFGLFFIGIFLGKNLYPKGKRNFKIFTLKGKTAYFATFLGKHSLVIYFMHQPIILLVLALMGYGEFLYLFNF